MDQIIKDKHRRLMTILSRAKVMKKPGMNLFMRGLMAEPKAPGN